MNEQQATLLITFLDNTPQVELFKVALVKQFYEMRDELNKRNLNRAMEKPIKRTLTDAIRDWKYTNKHAYSNINRLLVKVATGLSIQELKKSRGCTNGPRLTNERRTRKIQGTGKQSHSIH